MAARHLAILALFASLFLAGCPSSPPLLPDEVPGDFQFTYEMKVTDEDAFRRALEAEEAKAARPAAEEADSEEAAETRGLPRTYVYVDVTEPGRVKYEVHFGFGDSVKREGSFDLTEAAFDRIYRLVRNAEVEKLKKRYVGNLATGMEETYVFKGNLKWQVIDVKGERVPTLERMWDSVKTILLDFDAPPPQSEIYIIDKATGMFHRASCPDLEKVPDEKKVRKDSWVECVDAGGYPCKTCRPLKDG